MGIDAIDPLLDLAVYGAEVNVILGQHLLEMVHDLMMAKGQYSKSKGKRVY